MIMICAFPAGYAKDFVLVIDAGHGGHDSGALGAHAKEKNINLGVALKLGKMVKENIPGVKVVYTRKNDTFLTLQERADVANKAGGDLFISIHTNSVDRKSPNRKSVNGASTYTLGLHRTRENLEVAKRENSVILLEKDFSTRYEGFDPNSSESYIIFEFQQDKHMEQSVNFASDIQRQFRSVAGRADKGVRQAGFWVLAKTSMPSVLVELDFICNPKVENFLSSEEGQRKMAKSIYNAFVAFKSDYDRKQNSNRSKAENTRENLPVEQVVELPEEKNKNVSQKQVTDNEQKSAVNNTGKTVYKIQLLTSPKKLPLSSSHFKGLSSKSIDYYYENNLYKYTYGEFTSQAEIRREFSKIKKTFKDAFIVSFKDGKRVK